MQKDFHYYCIAVLTNHAGFSKEDAKTIAYASAYVDNQDEFSQYSFGNKKFTPVRTAHIGIKAFYWHIHRDVYIPFHFLPPEEAIGTPFGLVVKPYPEIAKKLFNEASKETNDKFRLIRLGVALHTIADTWAHQGFSGIKHDENSIDNVHLKIENNWEKFEPHPMTPRIGHARAYCNPDNPSLCWKYEYKLNHMKPQNINNRNDRFIIASEEIYKILCLTKNNTSRTWEEVKTKIMPCLSFVSSNEDKRCDNWKNTFQDLFFEHYDKDLWWNRMKPDLMTPHEWKELNYDQHYNRLVFPKPENFEEKEWILFNEAARLQREFVLANLTVKESITVKI